ncbi:MAG: HAD family hydrolase [Candidatus Odinarchaeota archaeon]
MIKLVTFDLWNTIFVNKHYSDLRVDYFIRFLKKNHISLSLKEVNNAFNIAFQVLDVDLDEIGYHHIHIHDRISKLLLELNINISKSECRKIASKFEGIMLKDPPPLKKGVIETLNELSKNYYIALISNIGITPGCIIKKVFKMYEIGEYFKLTLFSDETGFYKPNPIMFKTALKKFKCKPQNAIHIGDRLETDIKGAKECNMLTIWLNDSNSIKLNEIIPDYEIQQIYDAVSIIKGIS